MSGRPLRFGPPARQLLGILTPPTGPADLRAGVVLCNPFGQEAIRAHRLLKVLADRLAATGFHALRFDYFGTGDSDGDDADATFETWISDVHLASDELERQSGVSVRAWFGLRVGATLALLASRHAPPRRLVLWDPVVDGRAYLAELAQAHAASMVQGLDEPTETDLHPQGEILGFPLDGTLRDTILRIDPARLAGTACDDVRIVASPGAAIAPLVAALQAAGKRVTTVEIGTAVQWASDDAMNSAIVPADGLQGAVAACRDDA